MPNTIKKLNIFPSFSSWNVLYWMDKEAKVFIADWHACCLILLTIDNNDEVCMLKENQDTNSISTLERFPNDARLNVNTPGATQLATSPKENNLFQQLKSHFFNEISCAVGWNSYPNDSVYIKKLWPNGGN